MQDIIILTLGGQLGSYYLFYYLSQAVQKTNNSISLQDCIARLIQLSQDNTLSQLLALQLIAQLNICLNQIKDSLLILTLEQPYYLKIKSIFSQCFLCRLGEECMFYILILYSSWVLLLGDQNILYILSQEGLFEKNFTFPLNSSNSSISYY